MIGVAQIVKNESDTERHLNTLSELNEVTSKANELSNRAMISSIQNAKSIAGVKSELNQMIKGDIHQILETLNCVSSDISNFESDMTTIIAHLTKLSATIYDIQELIKDKVYDFENQMMELNKKVNLNSDLLKDISRTQQHEEIKKSLPPTPRIGLPKPISKIGSRINTGLKKNNT